MTSLRGSLPKLDRSRSRCITLSRQVGMLRLAANKETATRLVSEGELNIASWDRRRAAHALTGLRGLHRRVFLPPRRDVCCPFTFNTGYTLKSKACCGGGKRDRKREVGFETTRALVSGHTWVMPVSSCFPWILVRADLLSIGVLQAGASSQVWSQGLLVPIRTSTSTSNTSNGNRHYAHADNKLTVLPAQASSATFGSILLLISTITLRPAVWIYCPELYSTVLVVRVSVRVLPACSSCLIVARFLPD